MKDRTDYAAGGVVNAEEPGGPVVFRDGAAAR
jgi:hypothetical protein